LVRIDTLQSDFDTVLAIYRGTNLRQLERITENDDSEGGLRSLVFFPVKRSEVVEIAVDGVDGDAGTVQLAWEMPREPCVPPSAPDRPSPSDGSTNVPFEVTLTWNREPRVEKVLYGEDDRRDVYQVRNKAIREFADATVALVPRHKIRNVAGTWRASAATLQEEVGVCSSERFATQPSLADCSGVLVGPDIVATAAHCLTSHNNCSEYLFVFGFYMQDALTPVMEFAESQVYACVEPLGAMETNDGADWTLLRLDRPVEGRFPVRVRTTGEVAENTPLIVIGYPVGLPAKIAGGARVRENVSSSVFTSNLDTYVGSSGSPVFNANNLLLEGLLVRGEPDFFERGGCLVSNRCTDSGCDGEEVSRATEFVPFLESTVAPPPSVRYEVIFGVCGREQSLGTTEDTSVTLRGLQPGETYCWRIVARSCQNAPGPEWSFSTVEQAATTEFVRGDANPDEVLNLSDAVTILNFLFTGGPIDCFATADVDDNSDVNLTDAVYLLSYLFLGTEPPADPYEICDVDPTLPELDCENSICEG